MDEDELAPYLIIGLGNPGSAYKKTRHNVGFHLVKALAEKSGMTFRHAAHLIGDLGSATIHDKKVLALLPTTYMNSSGDAVRRCMDYYKVPPDHILVLCDDVALPLGTLRLRSKGSSGGHNGLKSIEAHVNTQYYARLRIGVGGPQESGLSDYVLGRFSDEEMKVIEGLAPKVIEVIQLWIGAGLAAAMQLANGAQKDQVKKEEGDNNG